MMLPVEEKKAICAEGYRRFLLVMAVTGLAFLLLSYLNITLGSVPKPLSEIGRALFRLPNADPDLSRILWKIRLPRMVSVALLGGALALSGFLLQTFFQNPIAGPFILGISSGAKLFVTICMIILLSVMQKTVSSLGLIAAAFAGSMLTMGLVLILAGKVRHSSLLIVSGVMIGYICSAATDMLISFADDASIVNLHNWSRGSFSGMSWDHVRVMFFPVTICSLLVFALSKPIAAFRLGERYAASVGVNVKRFRLLLVLLSSMLAAAVTAFAGPISFVGIAVPHLAKAAAGSSRPLYIIPICFLGGSVFCLLSDLIARVLFAPVALSISSVTAIFGAPVVIFVMLNRRREQI